MNPQKQTKAEYDSMMKQIDDAVYNEVALCGLPDNAVVTEMREIKFPDVLEVQISNKKGLSFNINGGESVKLRCDSVLYDDGEITYKYVGFMKAPE